MKRHLDNERGGVLVFVVLGMLLMVPMVGLTIDAGRGYILRAQLSRAADAAALAAAGALRSGTDVAERRARTLAQANSVTAGTDGVTLEVDFSQNELGERTVAVSASKPMPTLLMGLLGFPEVQTRAAAVAAVPPIDLVLVIDQSASLGMADAWEDLQGAAEEFVQFFDDEIDQVGLVSFNLRASQRFDLDQPFTAPVLNEIDRMTSASYTNAGEGLRLAYEQFQGGATRDRAVRAVVFFTDGQPTAARRDVNGRDRVVAGWTGSTISGYWNNPDRLPMTYIPRANGCRGVWYCHGWRHGSVLQAARDDGALWADQIRDQGTVIYTIGLGDLSQPAGSMLQPDKSYLRELANEEGVSDSDQPKGRMYFAPSALELRKVFRQVAEDLLARLAV